MEHNKQSVLFVDDDKATNFLNKKIASNHGRFSHIKTLQSGLDGLEFLRSCKTSDETKPDLIFLDINMPAMNGWEFLNEFYQLDEEITNNINVVILSTSSEPKDIAKFNEYENLLDFVNKPITTEILDRIADKCNSSTTIKR